MIDIPQIFVVDHSNEEDPKDHNSWAVPMSRTHSLGVTGKKTNGV